MIRKLVGLHHRDILDVQQGLDDFDISRPIDFSAVSDAMQRYLSTYGFDQIVETHQVSYSVGWLALPDYRLVLHSWKASNTRGTVLVCHGLFDHVGLFLPLVDHLISSGFSVLAVDFPGHGLSEGERAVIDDFSEYGVLIDEVLSRLAESLVSPVFAVGQSTGCAALMSYVLSPERDIPFGRLAFMAPLVRPRAWRRVRLGHAVLGRFVSYVPRRFGDNSHDPDFVEFLRSQDPLQPRHISTRWVGAMNRWGANFSRLPESDLPLLSVQGDEDDTVEWQTNLKEIGKKFSAHQIEILHEGRHHLVNEAEPWLGKAFAKVTEFLLKK